ncbi:MAG: thiamine diphosphokinase [Clostridia bacterium]
MEIGICYVIGAGEGFDFTTPILTNDYVIVADGGYKIAKEHNIPINLIVGDFDSLGFVPKEENVIILPKEKNDTDMLKALKLGLEKGYKDFVIMGGCGGRLSHTIANIQCLKFLASKGAKGTIIGNQEIITLLDSNSLDFAEDKKGLISIFALGDIALGVTLKGLKYPLDKFDITDSYPIGISNEFTGNISQISVRKGQLLIIINLY